MTEAGKSLGGKVGSYRLGRTMVLLMLGAMGLGVGLTRSLPDALDFAIRVDLGGAGQDTGFVDLGFDLAAYLAVMGGALAADAFGASLVLLISAGLAAGAGVAAAGVPSLPLLILARVIGGAASGSALAAAFVAIGTTTPTPERGWGAGLVLGGFVAGLWLATPLAVAMGLWVWRSPLALVSLGMAVWAGLWWAAVHRGPLAPARSQVGIRASGHLKGMLLPAFLAFAVAWGIGYWHILLPRQFVDHWHYDMALIPGVPTLRLGAGAACCLLAGLGTDLLFWGSGNVRSARQLPVAVGLLVALVAGLAISGAPGPGIAYWLTATDAGLAIAAVGILTMTLDIAAPRSGIALAVLGAAIGMAAGLSPARLATLVPADWIARALTLTLIGLGIPLAFLLRPDRPLPSAAENEPPDVAAD